MAVPALAFNPLPDPDFLIEVLRERAAVRAYLWAVHEIPDLHEAIDPLQAWAVEWGVVDDIGQDAVQRIFSDAFGAVQ